MRSLSRLASLACLASCVVCGCDGTGDPIVATDDVLLPDAPALDAPPSPPDAGPDASPPPWPACSACACTSTGLTPITELGADLYMGEPGGLYPGGSNDRPAAHENAGLALATAIQPLDGAGNPDPGGRYVLVSIGMSNTTQEFSAFVSIASGDPLKDTRLTIVDGAQGGQTAAAWADPTSMPWSVIDTRLATAGVTREQVVVAWVKVANAAPSGAFDPFVDDLAADMVAIARNLKDRFPNLQVTYWSSRIYAGYANGVSSLNPEPYAYQSAFAVKRLIQMQLDGDPQLAPTEAAWISWGPYLWADGIEPRADGLTWECSDLVMDGTHPSPSGRMKVAELLRDFVHTDTTARQWYLAAP